MPVKRVTPPEAAKLVEAGWTYVDVRSIPEFVDGHPAGAFNVPIAHLQPGRGMTPNPDFMDVMAKHFPKDAKLVMGCKSGGRSYRAADFLQSQGWTSVVDMQGGWDGERDGMGRVVVTGWRDSNLPAEKAAQAGRAYEDLSAK